MSDWQPGAPPKNVTGGYWAKIKTAAHSPEFIVIGVMVNNVFFAGDVILNINDAVDVQRFVAHSGPLHGPQPTKAP